MRSQFVPSIGQVQLPKIIAEGMVEVADLPAARAPLMAAVLPGIATRMPDVPGPFQIVCCLCHQHFTAPNGSVSDHNRYRQKTNRSRFAFKLVLGHATDNVGVMMLDLDYSGIPWSALLRKPGTQIVRMHVASYDFWT